MGAIIKVKKSFIIFPMAICQITTPTIKQNFQSIKYLLFLLTRHIVHIFNIFEMIIFSFQKIQFLFNFHAIYTKIKILHFTNIYEFSVMFFKYFLFQ